MKKGIFGLLILMAGLMFLIVACQGPGGGYVPDTEDDLRTITFDAQGGDIAGREIYSYKRAVGALLNTVPATRGGFVLKGWFKEKEYINEWDFETDVIVNDVTLYAKWEWKKYNLRATGPAGGWIFYINPDATADGWKYLEVNKEDLTADGMPEGYVLGDTPFFIMTNGEAVINGTESEIGSGLANTELIVDWLDNNPEDDTMPEYYPDEKQRAAYLCYNFEVDGYDDWYLPSFKELLKCYTNLYSELDENEDTFTKVDENFENTFCSSTLNSSGKVRNIEFYNNGSEIVESVSLPRNTRPIRSF